MVAKEFLKQKIDTQNKNIVDYSRILEITTNHLTEKYSEVILELFGEKKDNAKKIILEKIELFINENKMCCENLEIQELVEKIYIDSFEFQFLNKYIFNDEVEEINGNSWDCIFVNYSDGRVEKIEETFENPQIARDVVSRILRVSDKRVDDNQPIALGEIGKNKRITVMIPPVVDEEVGVSFSLRNVHSNKVDKDMFLNGKSATIEMLNFLENLANYGISICVAGATGSGKTTFLNWLLGTIPDHKRIYTIESGSRELDLIKRDKNGKIINNVVSTITKPNKNKDYEVTQDDLLAIALRYHPDLIAVGEMRDKEAYTAQDAVRTGHPTITTVHSENAKDTYDRILSLSLKANARIDDKKLFEYIVQAFPIIVYAKQLEDRSRKLTEILEAYKDEDDTIKYRHIYTFDVEHIEIIDGKTIITGEHKKKNNISEHLQKRLIDNGMPTKFLNEVFGVN